MATTRANDLQKYLLTCLMEECGEVIQIASKMIRFGLDDFHPKTGNIQNYQLLTNELNDIRGVIELLKENHVPLPLLDDKAAINAKRVKVMKYLKYTMGVATEENGTVKSYNGKKYTYVINRWVSNTIIDQLYGLPKEGVEEYFLEEFGPDLADEAYRTVMRF